MSENLIEVKNIKKYFFLRKGIFSRKQDVVKAVDDVSFEIKKGTTMGLVGESGSGKTTLGRVILRLIEPTDGKVFFKGTDIFSVSRKQMRMLRRKMQIIFQDPYSSLNPRMTVGDIIAEPLKVHRIAKGRELKNRVIELMERMGLRSEDYNRYPHEFSGGQRQRIGIARAIASVPEFIVADEPVSALDVSIQAQILNLLLELQKEYELTYLFISHDLRIVRYICDEVIVMYLGKIVERANKDELFSSPLHPYSMGLLSAVPVIDPQTKRRRIILSGEVPSPIQIPSGCSFHPRCPYAEGICREQVPELREIKPGHFVSCHLAEMIQLQKGRSE